jgi:hypothetical protein
MVSKRGRLTNLKKSPQGWEPYDSALEREYMVELERDPSVKSWTKVHGIRIPYTFLGISRHYLPDFLVTYQDDSQEIHETKGLPLLLWLSTKMKRQTAEDFCRENGYKYRVITKGQAAFYGKV